MQRCLPGAAKASDSFFSPKQLLCSRNPQIPQVTLCQIRFKSRLHSSPAPGEAEDAPKAVYSSSPGGAQRSPTPFEPRRILQLRTAAGSGPGGPGGGGPGGGGRQRGADPIEPAAIPKAAADEVPTSPKSSGRRCTTRCQPSSRGVTRRAHGQQGADEQRGLWGCSRPLPTPHRWDAVTL